MDLLTFDSVTQSALRVTASEKIQHYQTLATCFHNPKGLKKKLKHWMKVLKSNAHNADAFADAFGVGD